MKTKMKLLAGLLVVMMVAAMTVVIFADAGINPTDEPSGGGNAAPYFASYAGTVSKIEDTDAGTVYSIDKDGEVIANIISGDGTYVIGDGEIKEGDVIEGFYDTNAPATMIYPPRVTAEVITVNLPDSQSIKVDRFDGDLISSDGNLKLNISDKTEIVLQDGTAFDGEIANRALAVVYDVATKSIPAQTTPIKVVVLFEKVTTLPIGIDGSGDGIAPPIAELPITGDINGEIVVDGVVIEAPAPYVKDDGVVMVPLRAVAEAMNFNVTWEEETQSIMLGNSISLSIGKDYYTYAKMAPIELGTAPELMDDHTFVPLVFFRDVVRAGSVYVYEGQIIINSEEAKG